LCVRGGIELYLIINNKKGMKINSLLLIVLVLGVARGEEQVNAE
jgi:hypothetical protein